MYLFSIYTIRKIILVNVFKRTLSLHQDCILLTIQIHSYFPKFLFVHLKDNV
jgi:hypothetical protein